MTADELRQFQTNPFEPFRIDVAHGEPVFITRRFQIAVMPTQFAAAVDERLRFFKLDQVAHVEKIAPARQEADA